MKRILFTMLLAASLSAEAQTQTYETEFARPLNEVLTDIQNRFGVRLKYDIDTVGKVLPYADFRIRPYSVEESLTNVLAPFDYKFVKQKGNMYKLKAYEYPRRTDADGEKMLAYLNTLYTDRQSFSTSCRFSEKRGTSAFRYRYFAGSMCQIQTYSFKDT